PAPARAAPPPRPPPTTAPRPRRTDLAHASAEEIAAMLGSTAPVIPPASDAPEETPAPAPGAPPASARDTAEQGDPRLATLVDEIRKLARPRSQKLDALLNGSCRALSFEDGVLTLGFYEDKFHKKQVEETANRRVYEEIAAGILGAPASIRCIIAPRPARALSPLVQHAVQNHGATIVSEE
ncbi:MAG: hypothetical protein KGK07_05290, partial [Chloroflexota bacterium]|nr:hypothetical protein [Chloroflexota bacterium]